jgi:hypothetical protein
MRAGLLDGMPAGKGSGEGVHQALVGALEENR